MTMNNNNNDMDVDFIFNQIGNGDKEYYFTIDQTIDFSM